MVGGGVGEAGGGGGASSGEADRGGLSCRAFLGVGSPSVSSLSEMGARKRILLPSASFSSGGFSNYFGQPSYQQTAVSSYLSALGSTNKGKFNTSGRGFPDVATQGVNFEIVVDGDTGLVGGTSASSPTFASVIALINDALLTAGKSPLGFLNPFLYANPSAFIDITSGQSLPFSLLFLLAVC